MFTKDVVFGANISAEVSCADSFLDPGDEIMIQITGSKQHWKEWQDSSCPFYFWYLKIFKNAEQSKIFIIVETRYIDKFIVKAIVKADQVSDPL
mgnify:CR=1 FL=1